MYQTNKSSSEVIKSNQLRMQKGKEMDYFDYKGLFDKLNIFYWVQIVHYH